MAEGRGDPTTIFTPLEEEYIREHEENDIDQQLLREKDIASQKLWLSFQDSATAVAHLFRDCQHQAGLAAWLPFHESASAVTQLYKESVDVCRQCSESGIKYGQRKRTKEIVSWAKKSRKYIKREELLAFLLDKPYTESSSTHTKHETEFERSVGHQLSGLSLGHMPPSGHTPCAYPSTGHGGHSPCAYPTATHSPTMSPRRRTMCREEPMCNEGEPVLSSNGRKRSANSGTFDLDCGFGPIAKRIRL